MGTVISPAQLKRIQAMVDRCRSGTVLSDGYPLTNSSQLDGFDFSRGCFYPPTVISDISVDNELWKEEIFGPVIVVKSFMVRLVSTSSILSPITTDDRRKLKE